MKVAYNKRLDTSILVDGSGRTLYMFTEDHGAAKLCTPRGPWGAACPAIWPPLTGRGKPQAGQGINSALFGVTKRSDGKSQITYNRHPLYYFHGGSGAPAGDKKPGDINGQGFASEWYVLSPKGAPIRKL
ncbi:MAG TPA: hypothetical protein VFK76_06075 [Gaiellaceae bacterium]|nr:hypothetical protein [Gaiellaceae bacterium]